MELIDYMSQNQVVLPIPPNEDDEEFVVSSTNPIISNLQLLDNVFLNTLDNQNQAPYRLIKTLAESETKLSTQLKQKPYFKQPEILITVTNF